MEQCNSKRHWALFNFGYLALYKFLDTQRNVLLLVYKALFLSLIDYCCIVWANTSKTNLRRLYKLQKRAGRVILGVDTTFSSRSIFICLHWLPIDFRIVYFTALMTYKALNNLTPSYIRDIFNPLSEVSSVNTRGVSDGNLYLPMFRTAMGQRSFSYRATKIWNSIPPSIRNNESVSLFKSALHEYLFTKFCNEGSDLD